MHKITVGLACAALALPAFALSTAPIAGAYRSCAEAQAAGAAPLYAGQPGYSRKLDRDGDGVACESGSGGGAPAYVPAPLAPAAPPAPAAPATVAPAPTGPVVGPNVVVDWTGTDCIDITVPTSDGASTQSVNRCGGHAEFTQSEAPAEALIGADPVIGRAASLSCEILDDRLIDRGVAGDGHDVNCLTTVSQLP
jgi:hypothetical protein